MKHPFIVSSCLASALALVPSLSAAAQESRPAEELPAASELFARSLEAMGSEEVLEHIQSGSFTTKAPPMMTGAAEFKVQAMSPDKCRIDAEFGEGESAMIVINGRHMWSRGPGETDYEYGDDDGRIAPIAIMMAPHFFVFTAESRFEKRTTTGTETIGDDESYRVELSNGEDAQTYAIFFSARTGLCTAIELPIRTGEIYQYVVKEWGREKGLQVITKASMDMTAMGMGEALFEFTDFVFNQVEEKVFEMPDEVKEMIDAGSDGG